MSLATNITNLATRVATEFKSIRTLINGNAADLSGLNTTVKSTLVGAINEIKTQANSLAASSGAQINDTTPSGTTTYSSTKINAAVAAATAALVNSSPAALDTLKELSDALGGDASFAATTATALGNRVRFDAVQSLTAPQKVQANANMGSASTLDVGDTSTDFVATFNAGLV